MTPEEFLKAIEAQGFRSSGRKSYFQKTDAEGFQTASVTMRKEFVRINVFGKPYTFCAPYSILTSDIIEEVLR